MTGIIKRISSFFYDLAIRMLPLVILIALALTTFWLLKKNSQGEEQLPIRAKIHIPDYVLTNIKLTGLNPNGTTKYRLLGRELKHYEDDASIDIKQPKMRSFSENLPPTTVKANLGHLDGNLSELELFDQAEISRPDQIGKDGIIINPKLTATSSYFKILINDDIVKTNKPVKIERGLSTMTASDGAEFDNVEQKMKLFGDVKGYIDTNATNTLH